MSDTLSIIPHRWVERKKGGITQFYLDFVRALLRSKRLSEEEVRDILENASTSHYAVNKQILGLMRNDPASPLRPS
ncbi:MAG: hypothetical protein NVSMB27_12300 [Ktedonobacteraceae bacterium]